MEKLIEILEDLNPEVDYNTCTNLIDGVEDNEYLKPYLNRNTL